MIRDAVIVAEAPSGRVVLWNPAATALFGYTAEEARDLTIDLLVPPGLRRRHRSGLERYAAVGHGPFVDADAPLELPALRKGGEELRVELTLSPVADPDRRGDRRLVLAIVRNVTERARLEAEHAALLAAEREYAKRLGQLSVLRADFTAMVAHELAGPLAAIRGLTDVLATGELGPEARAQALATIQAQTATLTALVADVRAAAAAERDDFAVRPHPVPVAVLVAEAVAFARTLPGEHPVTASPPPRVQVRADPERIGQVLRNLLSNAAKYSPDGTPIELRAIPHGSTVTIQVVDHGYGIHPYDLTRIFEKFGRGRDEQGRKVSGVGLGLYLSRRIVRAHGAELTAESLPGVGSVFGFELEVAP